MSVSFNHIVGVVKLGSTGYFDIDAVWIDYIYLENNTAVVADASAHGPLLELCHGIDVKRGQTYKVSLNASHEKKGRFKFKATSMELLTSLDTASPAKGPSFAVILNSSILPDSYPYTHDTSILMIQGIASSHYIGLKYMIKDVLFADISKKSNLWELIFSYSFKWGPSFRLIELESICNFHFIHSHDFPCDRIRMKSVSSADNEQIIRLREIALKELTRRYASGEADRDPKVDLPSGKCDIIEEQGEHRYEDPLEACVRELREETGLLPSSLLMIGASDCICASMNIRSCFYFFAVRENASARVTAKDAYVASSWTHPSHIQAFMHAVEGSDRQHGRFDSLRRVGLPDEVFTALAAVQREPCEAEMSVWQHAVGAMDVDAVARKLEAASIAGKSWRTDQSPASSKGALSSSNSRTATPAKASCVLETGHEYDGTVVRIAGRGIEIEVRRGSELVACVADGIVFNRKTHRLFLTGDAVKVIATDNGKRSRHIQVCLTQDFVRPLLILDVNGVLGIREAFTSHSKARAFKARSNALAFVQFVSTFYEIALWSCSKKQNLDEDVQVLFPHTDDFFLFRWHQDNSTNLWPRCSDVSDKKPLFLKELSKVWQAYPCYSATNTILVDNHLEKFERNPLGTCIIIPEYDGKNEDGSIDETSDLCVHLKAMAAGDTQQYMLSKRGVSAIFPTQHPQAPDESVDIDKKTTEEMSKPEVVIQDQVMNKATATVVLPIKKKAEIIVVDDSSEDTQDAFDDTFLKSFANRNDKSGGRRSHHK